MTVRRRWRLALAAWSAMALAAPALAQAPAAAASAPPANSVMDDRLLYQLLVAEMALAQGDWSTAYDWLLDAARRTRDDGLFRRSVDIALRARAGEKALAAARAWRLARPESLDALRLQLQILMVLNKGSEVTEPLRSLLEQTPDGDRANLISALPRFLQRANNPRLVAAVMEDVLEPYRALPATRIATLVTLGRAWLEAKEIDRALGLAQRAYALDPAAPGPPLLAMELMRERAQAEATVLQYLKQAKALPEVRLTYVRVLTSAQRYADAIVQLEAVTRAQPELAAPYLSLGALHLELKHTQEGEAALMRYLELAQKSPQPPAATASAGNPGSADDDDDGPGRADQGVMQAWLMLAQAAEKRGDFKAAEGWLARIEDPQRALEVQSRRASILARQGQVAQARELIRGLPERRSDDARAKVLAEASLLREVKQWAEAFEVLEGGAKRFSDDTDLIYEQAMVAEKLDRLDDMERLLRRVIELKPESAHAHNALGYSLADRKLRLPEARQLVQRALELAPGDPFITDSLGWIEFRLGNREEAVRLLRQAYAARPDTEIGAHLGEVLWSQGKHDDAREIWREAAARDGNNDVLRETLARLGVKL